MCQTEFEFSVLPHDLGLQVADKHCGPASLKMRSLSLGLQSVCLSRPSALIRTPFPSPFIHPSIIPSSFTIRTPFPLLTGKNRSILQQARKLLHEDTRCIYPAESVDNIGEPPTAPRSEFYPDLVFFTLHQADRMIQLFFGVKVEFSDSHQVEFHSTRI